MIYADTNKNTFTHKLIRNKKLSYRDVFHRLQWDLLQQSQQTLTTKLQQVQYSWFDISQSTEAITK